MSCDCISNYDNRNFHISKSADSVLDYSFDWRPWLDSVDDTILGYVFTAQNVSFSPVPVSEPGIITAMVSGGVPYTDSSITCQITTGAGRVEKATIWFMVQ